MKKIFLILFVAATCFIACTEDEVYAFADGFAYGYGLYSAPERDLDDPEAIETDSIEATPTIEVEE